jgi:hypothetical protein
MTICVEIMRRAQNREGHQTAEVNARQYTLCRDTRKNVLTLFFLKKKEAYKHGISILTDTAAVLMASLI